jgi:hypothetical protein
MATSQNYRLRGMIFGLLFCGFPVLALWLAQHEVPPREVPLQWEGVLALFFVWGVWIFVAGLFNIGPDSALSSFAGSIIAALFAVVTWLFAWRSIFTRCLESDYWPIDARAWWLDFGDCCPCFFSDGNAEA